MTVKFTPLGDRILVERIETEGTTPGGIIIPDTAKEKPIEGKVICVGAGSRDDKGNVVAIAVKAGQRIVFGKWSGSEVKLDGKDYLVIKETDVLGIIE